MSEGHEPAVPCAKALHLETLNHARHNLMLQATVLSFCVLSDSNEVDIIIPASSEYAQACYIITASSTIRPFQAYAQASGFAACRHHKGVAAYLQYTYRRLLSGCNIQSTQYNTLSCTLASLQQ